MLLDAPLETIQSRIYKRARAQEEAGEGGGGIPIDYLQRLHQSHLDYFESVDHPKYRIDATSEPEQVAQAVLSSIASVRASPRSPMSIMEF